MTYVSVCLAVITITNGPSRSYLMEEDLMAATGLTMLINRREEGERREKCVEKRRRDRIAQMILSSQNGNTKEK